MVVSAGNRLVRLVLALVFGVACWPATAAPFGGLVVFGDSLSDVGNIAQAPLINTPGPYYWNGRFSNGPVYAESLATGLGFSSLTRSTAGGGDYAYGGAKTTGTSFPTSLFVQDVDDQVTQYLNATSATASTLYVVFAGANDLIGGQTNMNVPVNSLSNSIGRLITSGARQLLVSNLPPLGHTPRFNGSPTTLAQYNTRSQQFNTALATMLNGVESNNPAVTIHRLDVSAMFSAALANPAAFGLVNVTTPAAPGLEPGDTSYNTSLIAPNANQYLFWDELHPTATVHAILAQRALDLFRLPSDFNRDNIVDGSDYVLWRKGVGTAYIPYDYQIWRSHFGESAGGGGSTVAGPGDFAVPEPSAVLVGSWTLWPVVVVMGRR
jgi:phospholipase/lecithinase/hemolysin